MNVPLRAKPVIFGTLTRNQSENFGSGAKTLELEEKL